MIFKEIQPTPLSASKERLNTEGSIKLHIEIGDLVRNVLFTVLEKQVFYVLLGTFFIDEYILSILSDEE